MAAASKPSGTVIAIVGATGTGKSALAVNLAKKLVEAGTAAEIVSADAMQLYRGMDIGTAKITPPEMHGITHHMLDVLDPHQEATVAAYQLSARAVVEQIHSRRGVAVVVGGSGLYVNGLLYDFQFPGSDPKYRETLNARHTSSGLTPLIDELLEKDPEAQHTVDLNNPRRVIRALEVLHVTGRPMASQLPEAPRPVWPTLVVGIAEDREVLVQRLDDRVTEMWRDGIVAETEKLIPQGIRHSPTAGRAIGYAQALAQIEGEMTEAEAIAQTQFLTRRYARRQVSWFKRLPQIHWITSEQSQSEQTQEQLLRMWQQLAAGDTPQTQKQDIA